MPFNFKDIIKEILFNYRINKYDWSKPGREKSKLAAEVLRYYCGKSQNLLKRLNYNQSILTNKDDSFVLADGVFLSTRISNRYFKSEGNEGKALNDFLKSKGINVKTMVDAGANFGEISLYFCRQGAIVIAIEPSPENIKIFKHNCQAQIFPISNLILVEEAISDKKGTANMSKGFAGENSIMPEIVKNQATEEIKTDTLNSIIDRYDFDNIDFLKLDIEGAEPLLMDSLIKMDGRIKAIHLEIIKKVSKDGYRALTEYLFNNDWQCYTEEENALNSLEEIYKELARDESFNLWFIKKNITE